MELQFVEKIRDLFVSKAPTHEHLMTHPNFEHDGIAMTGYSIFDDTTDDANKVASIMFSGNKENSECSVTLHIGWNKFEFLENPNMCMKIISEYVIFPQKIIEQ